MVIASLGLKNYESGTFVPTDNSVVNLVVTLVGYDPDKGYLIKNIWGKKWGLGGYAYLSEKSQVCNYAIYPIL